MKLNLSSSDTNPDYLILCYQMTILFIKICNKNMYYTILFSSFKMHDMKINSFMVTVNVIVYSNITLWSFKILLHGFLFQTKYLPVEKTVIMMINLLVL